MSTPRQKLKVDTFPFLAVLLCAMGALIVVLLTMDRKARRVAKAKAEAAVRRQSDEHDSALTARREEYERRKGELHAAWQRKSAALKASVDAEEAALDAELREVRARLAEASRRLGAEFDTLRAARMKLADEKAKLGEAEAALAAAHNAAGSEVQRLGATEAARVKLAVNLEAMERTIKEIEADRKRDTNTFSLIPYHGKRGSSQRPVYVECAVTGLIFHPDRKRVGADDARALRAEVVRRLSGRGGDPYLMLLVRPDGIDGYYRLRASVGDLDVTFGYEMVDAGWEFHIPDDGKEPAPKSVGVPPKPVKPRAVGGDGVAKLLPSGPSAVPAKVGLSGSVNLQRPRPFGSEDGPASNPDAALPGGGGPGIGGTPGTGGGVFAPGGGVGTGGLAGTGGAKGAFSFTGGTPGTGGMPGASAPLVGTPGPGGSPGNGTRSFLGGAPGAGGMPGTGPAGDQGGTPGGSGLSGTGGDTGGTPGTGGASRTGSKPGTGGNPGTEKLPGTGGATRTGGAPGAVGAPGTGGANGTGGAPVTGDATATANPSKSNTGPYTSGLPRTGGTPGAAGTPPAGNPSATGGAASSGGSPGTGGSPAGGAPGGGDASAASGGADGQSPPGSGQSGGPSPADRSGRSPGDAPSAAPPGGGVPGAGAGRVGSRGSSGSSSGEGSPDDGGPRMPELPEATIKPRPRVEREPLRAARLDSNEVTVFIECCADYVVVYPGRKVVKRDALAGGTLLALVKKGLARPLLGGGTPRPQVRFLIRPEGERTFHEAMDVLGGLDVPMRQSKVQPDDDVARVVGGR